MKDLPPPGPATWVGLLLVVAAAAGARGWYVAACADMGAGRPALAVQGPGPAFADGLARNVQEHRWFGGTAPLAAAEEQTAHVAPGYPWLVGLASRHLDEPEFVLRWLQVALGTLAVVCLFFFARRAFHSDLTATVAGLLCAVHPFWVINTGELADGVLGSFLLAAALMLGTRGGQVGGAFTSLLFGLALAGLAMVRAALLPFALVAFLWFLWRCRGYRWGWFAGLLAFLGFANGLAPWAVRNYRAFGEPVPIASSTYLHLWMGNNPRATGGPLDEPTLRASVPPGRLEQVLAEPNQVRRYGLLGREVLDEVVGDPTAAVGRRITAGQAFVLGERWLRAKELVDVGETNVVAPPEWLANDAEYLLRVTLLGMGLLAFLGWRWTYAWAWNARLAALATVCVPLPYLLTHADTLHGPRLPLDGLLLCYAAYALTSFVRRPDAAAS